MIHPFGYLFVQLQRLRRHNRQGFSHSGVVLPGHETLSLLGGEAVQPQEQGHKLLENNGMNPSVLGQTDPGGDDMKQQEITMGRATYQVRRVYQGICPISELVMKRMTQNIPSRQSVDESPKQGL